MSTSLVDFQAPFDPTGFTTITGAQLLQLVVAATPYVDKGLVMVEADNAGIPVIPDATTNTKWQRYLWLRIIPNTSTLVLYAWNPNGQSYIVYSDGSGTQVLSNWIPVISSAIPPGSITGSLIAANTILPGNINLSLLATALGFNPGTTVTTGTAPAAGDISGTYATGFSIGAGKILTALLADLNVTGAKIANATIDYTKLIGDGTAGDMLKSTGTPAIAPVWFTPLQITTGLANPNAGGTDDNKLLAVNSGAAGTFKYSTFASYADAYTFSKFTSAATAITLGAAVINTAHSLGAMPTFVRAVCVCQVGELGYTAGDEVNAEAFSNNTNSDLFVYGASATNVFVSTQNNASNFGLIKKDGTGIGAATLANWKVKVYAHL